MSICSFPLIRESTKFFWVFRIYYLDFVHQNWGRVGGAGHDWGSGNNELLDSSALGLKSSRSWLLKGTVQQDFDLQFFSSFEPAWATDQWVKIVSFFVFVFAKIFNFFRISAQYHTARSHVTFRIFLKGQSNEILYLFFRNSSLPWPLSNGLKYFKFL